MFLCQVGEGDNVNKDRTVSDDVGGKSLSDTSTSTGVKSTVIHTSVNIFVFHHWAQFGKVQEDLYGNKLGMLKQVFRRTNGLQTTLFVLYIIC
jgi:hypothetical protein